MEQAPGSQGLNWIASMRKMKSLSLMSLGHMTTHWYVGVLILVIPYFQKEFSLSFTGVGLLISLRSLAGAAGNVTSGFAADFLGRRALILIVSVAGMGLCWFFSGFVQNYLFILILLPLATMFSNLWHAPSMSILSEAYPGSRGFALGIHGAAANLGQSISPLLVGILISYGGWRSAIKINVLPAVLTALVLILTLPNLQLSGFRKKNTGDLFNLLKNQLLKNRTLLIVSLISSFRTMGQRGLETFLALFLAKKLGLGPAFVGLYLSILTVSSTFPEPLMGWISDRVGRKTVLLLSLAVSGLSVIAVTLARPGFPVMAILALLGFFHYSLRPIIFAFALDVTPPEIGASTISYVFTWNQSLSAIAPILGGFLADAFGIDFALYLTAILCLGAAALVCLVKTSKD